jgi:predicted nucleotide-binding protein
VPRIDQSLLERLSNKLEVGITRVYQLIDAKVRETHLPRHLAAVTLASERGINISKYASADDLAIIRSIAKAYSPPPVHISTSAATLSGRQPSQKKRTKLASSQPKERGNTVFVVHGRNEKARKALFSLLRAFKLQPIEWNEALRKTGQGSPYVGTILESAFSRASAIVVLLTPDDEARLKKKFLTKRDSTQEHKLTGQARPNVLFEAGMAFGRNANSTILVQIGDVRPFSDIAGRHIVYLSNLESSRNELATKLISAGCRVDTSGNDWMDAGDFEL